MMQTYLSVALGALVALLFHFWAERHPGRWQRFRCAYLHHEVEADPAGGLRCWRCLHYFPPVFGYQRLGHAPQWSGPGGIVCSCGRFNTDTTPRPAGCWYCGTRLLWPDVFGGRCIVCGAILAPGRCVTCAGECTRKSAVDGYLQMGLNAGMEPNELRPLLGPNSAADYADRLQRHAEANMGINPKGVSAAEDAVNRVMKKYQNGEDKTK